MVKAAPLPPADRVLPPVFRWPGGKRWLVPLLVPLVGSITGTYFEPFFGGGALFFALRPKRARISDTNADLMACYQAIRDDPIAVASHLRSMPTDEASYYATRAMRPANDIEGAARFIFLASHAFGGVYRVNRKGAFNVPYGRRDYLHLGDAGRLEAYSTALKGSQIDVRDFEEAISDASDGDFAYLDPPYTVAHSNNGFLRYNARIFSWADQIRLARVAEAAATRGCRVVVSGVPHAAIRELYPTFRELVVDRRSSIAADRTRRAIIQESVFTNVE